MKDLQFDYEVIGIFKKANFVLLDKGEDKCCRYIAAHYPRLNENGDLTCWGQGHYCDTLKEAMDVVMSWLPDDDDEEDILDGDLEDVRDTLLEEEVEDDLSDMYPCDFSGYCAGTSCSRFFQCKGKE